MNQDVHIEVEERSSTGKNESRRLRHEGYIPATVYGGGREPVSVRVDPRPIEMLLDSPQGFNTLIHLKIGERELKRMVMIRDVQRDPVNERLEHADFVRVEMDEPVVVQVPVELTGTAVGVKTEGGLIDFISREVSVRVLPANIPASLVGDISGLHIGQHLEAKDLQIPEDVELLTPPTQTVANCVGKPVEVEPEAEVAEEEAEAAEETAEEGEEPEAE